MNNIGPQPHQFLSNAQQVGLSSFVNTKALKAESEKQVQEESAQLSDAAQTALEEHHEKKAEEHLQNAKQAGAQVEDPAVQQARMKKPKGKKKLTPPPNTPLPGQPGSSLDEATMQRLNHELNQDDEDEIDELEEVDERTPEEILEGVPEAARVAAGRMVESQPVDKLVTLKPIPENTSRELGEPELDPVALLPVELEPALLGEEDLLRPEPSPEEQAFMEQQVGEMALAAQLNGEAEMLMADEATRSTSGS